MAMRVDGEHIVDNYEAWAVIINPDGDLDVPEATQVVVCENQFEATSYRNVNGGTLVKRNVYFGDWQEVL